MRRCILVVALAGCSGPGPTPPSPSSTVASITVAADSMTAGDSLPLIAGGDTARVKATALDASGNPVTGVAFTWTTSDANVATVSNSGLITAVGLGQADITVTVADPSSSAMRSGVDFAIRSARSASKIHTRSVPHIVVTPDSASIDIAQTASFHAVAKDYRGNQPWSNYTVTWGSSNSGIASVSPPTRGSSASALGVSYGTTHINATVAIGVGQFYGSASLTVVACQGALNVPSWTVDAVSYTYAPLGVGTSGTGYSSTYAINEDGNATAQLAVAEVDHPHGDSSIWAGKTVGTASESNTLTVMASGTTVTSSETTNGSTPLTGDFDIRLAIVPTTLGVCWYVLDYGSGYTYTAQQVSGTSTHQGGVVFQVIDTLPSPTARNQWTLTENELQVTAQVFSSFGSPPTGDYYFPGTELTDQAAAIASTKASVTLHLHANSK